MVLAHTTFPRSVPHRQTQGSEVSAGRRVLVYSLQLSAKLGLTVRVQVYLGDVPKLQPRRIIYWACRLLCSRVDEPQDPSRRVFGNLGCDDLQASLSLCSGVL